MVHTDTDYNYFHDSKTLFTTNIVDNKFADRYIRLDISAELPFHNISKPSDNSFAEYYFEDDVSFSLLCTN